MEEPWNTYFAFAHLPPHLQEVSQPFKITATHILNMVPPGDQRTLALQKLLESKDCAVRAALPLKTR